MSAEATVPPPETCDEYVVIDFDGVYCDLTLGHPGLHSMRGEGGRIHWAKGDGDDS